MFQETKKVVVEQSIAPDTSKLNNKQLAKLFKQQSPEFDGVVLDFKQKIEEAAKLAKVGILKAFYFTSGCALLQHLGAFYFKIENYP